VDCVLVLSVSWAMNLDLPAMSPALS